MGAGAAQRPHQHLALPEHGGHRGQLRVPPVWSGKDATFSTGCTKEMRIALDMQRSHPELQIVGPGPEKFFRRGDYGVGKFFDATISNANQE